ncbi:transposase [Microcystis elabens FACHB-917]|nr:transposase [Microcystis elabens FACHB-917]
MKRKRHTPKQIIRKLRTAEQLLNQDQTVADVCRILEVSAPTYHRWQQLYGGMKATEALAARLLRSSNASRSWSRRTDQMTGQRPYDSLISEKGSQGAHGRDLYPDYNLERALRIVRAFCSRLDAPELPD